MSKLKVFTAFSGYDSQMLALRRAGVDSDLVGWSEIDQYAIEAHNKLFPEYANRNFGDIKKIKWDRVPDFDLFTYSSPCQDFSVAGQGAGGEKGSGTRSSLLWECEKAIKNKKPKYLLLENVPALVNKTNIGVFEAWCRKLERMGYKNYWKVLCATDFNVPQTRNRLYMVSILGKGSFQFPDAKKLTKSLKDIVETDVDEKYFISNNGVKWRIESAIKGFNKNRRRRFGQRPEDNYLISPQRDHHSGAITGYYKAKLFRTICTSNTTSTAQWLKYAGRIRRLTPFECFLLMGLTKQEARKIIDIGISDTQLYKLAGNSIVVDVLEGIFTNLFQCQNQTLNGLRGLTKKEIHSRKLAEYLVSLKRRNEGLVRYLQCTKGQRFLKKKEVVHYKKRYRGTSKEIVMVHDPESPIYMITYVEKNIDGEPIVWMAPENNPEKAIVVPCVNIDYWYEKI